MINLEFDIFTLFNILYGILNVIIVSFYLQKFYEVNDLKKRLLIKRKKMELSHFENYLTKYTKEIKIIKSKSYLLLSITMVLVFILFCFLKFNYIYILFIYLGTILLNIILYLLKGQKVLNNNSYPNNTRL